MITPLSQRNTGRLRQGQRKPPQGSVRDAERAMTEGFKGRIRAHAREDARRGEYMSGSFHQMCQTRMRERVSPDRNGPKSQVMSAIQAALREPHPLEQMLNYLLEKLSNGGSAKLQICSLQQTAEIRDARGEVIASYSSLSGWTDVQTRGEHWYYSETAAIYQQAYREARSEMKQESAPLLETRA